MCQPTAVSAAASASSAGQKPQPKQAQLTERRVGMAHFCTLLIQTPHAVISSDHVIVTPFTLHAYMTLPSDKKSSLPPGSRRMLKTSVHVLSHLTNAF